MKTCKKCGGSVWYASGKARPDHKCRTCHNANQKKRYAANPAKQTVPQRRHRLKKLYGLTEANLESMKQAQNGVCKICEIPAKLMVDHCHKTGVVRGLLCQACNSLLGYARDNTETLIKAATYLKETQ